VTRGECAGAVTAAILMGAAGDGVLAEADFNTVHAKGSLKLGFATGSSWEKHTYFATDKTTFVPGDFIYMVNKSDYLTKCPNGFWQGENCLYIGGDKYSGLGIDSKSEDDMRTELAKGYKRDTKTDVPNPLSDHIKWDTGTLRRLRVKP
jgi:Protein-glutamine gamma-glutamyltransferase